MTDFDPDTAHVLPVEIVEQVARVCAAFDAALVNRTGCVEQGDGDADLAVTTLLVNGFATSYSPDNKPADVASADDVKDVARYARGNGMRMVFADAEQAQKFLGHLDAGGRLSTVSIPEGVDHPLFRAEVTPA